MISSPLLSSPLLASIDRTAFDPLGVDRFAREFLGSVPVQIRGERERFDAAFATARFYDRIRDVTPDPAARATAQAQRVHDDGHFEYERVRPRDAIDRVAAGDGVVFEDIHESDEPARRMTQGLRATLRYEGYASAKLYVSPEGTGVGWHFDPVHVFILQVGGAKRWRHGARPCVVAPAFDRASRYIAEVLNVGAVESSGSPTRPPSDRGAVEMLMETGDLFYFPPGTWHRTVAEGGVSSSLSIMFKGCAYACLTRLALASAVDRLPSFRQELRGFAAGELTRDVLEERLADARAVVGGWTARELLRFGEGRRPISLSRPTFETLLAGAFLARAVSDVEWRRDIHCVRSASSFGGDPFEEWFDARIAETRALVAGLDADALVATHRGILADPALRAGLEGPTCQL